MKTKKTIKEILNSEDPLYELAKKTVIEMGYVRASLLQRRLKIGYAKSAYLIERLENLGDSFPAEQRALTDLLILVQEEKRRQVR